MTRAPRPDSRPTMRESEILRAIRLELGSDADLTLWRENVGALPDVTGRLVRYGMAPGAADLVGLLGPAGRFLALEVKVPGMRPRAEQLEWGAIVQRRGGVYAVVHSVEEAQAVIYDARGELR